MKSVLASVCFLLCCLFTGASPLQAQKARLTIALQDSPDMLPTLVAEHSGYFSKEGLETRPVVFRSGGDLHARLAQQLGEHCVAVLKVGHAV